MEGYFDENGNYIDVDEDPAAVSLLENCVVAPKGDRAHKSATGDAASAHGWWTGSWDCRGLKKTVTVYLQELYSDGHWRTKATSRAYVKARHYGGGRATARRDCDNHRYTGWRSIVFVSNKSLTTAWRNIYCRVA